MSKDKQSIQVTIRVRPLSQKQKLEDNRVCVDVEEQTHSIQTFYGNENKKYTFDSICNNNTQDDMFEKVGKKSTNYCLEGYNCTIFAYGQTGSGKTFTMMGVDPAHQNYQNLRGLIPRTLQYLFESIDMQIKQTSSEYIIRCSFLQIYNEQIIDLLNPKNNNLQIKGDIKIGVYVDGITEEIIFKSQQALNILKKGSKGRHVGSTCYNEASSRSHSVFTMRIQSKHTKNGVVNTKKRYFHFVDLAGSQKTKLIDKSRLSESLNINTSLFTLGKVINGLSESKDSSKTKVISYRESKLTLLLSDSLGGNSKTHLIANVSPCTMSYNETSMTLNFARRVKLIKVKKAEINEDASGNVQNLKNQLKRLKQEMILLKNWILSKGFDIPKLQNEDSLNQSSSQMMPTPKIMKLPTQVSNSNNQQQKKMLSMLNQYVSEQLDKQTKFQQQIARLNKKIEFLSEGLKKFSQADDHLRMIISVHEEKAVRMKKTMEKLVQKIQVLQNQSALRNDGEQMKNAVSEIYSNQREEYLQQSQKLRSIVKRNTEIILRLMRQCKSYETELTKDTSNDNELFSILRANSEFLCELKQNLKEITKSNKSKGNEYNGKDQQNENHMQAMIKQQMRLVQNEFKKKEIEMEEQIEQLQLQLSEMKNNNEENETLLKQAVSKIMQLQEELKIKSQTIETLQKSNEKLKHNQQVRENGQKLKNDEIKKLNQQINRLKDQLKKIIQQRDQLSEKSQKIEQESQHRKATILQLMSAKQSSQQTVNKLQEQLSSCTEQIKQIQIQFSQYKQQAQSKDNQLTTIEQQLNTASLHLAQAQSKLKNTEQQMSKSMQQLQQKLTHTQKQLQKHKQTITHNEHKIKIIQEKNTMSQNEIDFKQAEIQTLNAKIDDLQASINHHKQNESHLETKIAQLQQALSLKEQNEQQMQVRFRVKEEELLQSISQWQSSTDSSLQEMNKIKLQSLQLKHAKSELQAKINKLNQQNKQLTQTIEYKVKKIQELTLEMEEKQTKLTTQKQANVANKETIRKVNYLLEEQKLQLVNLSTTITQKDEYIEELNQKTTTLAQQLSITKKELSQQMMKLKQQQTKYYCLQKSTNIQKQALLKQNQKKSSKLTETLNEKLLQLKQKEKQIHELTENYKKLSEQYHAFKQMSVNNQQIVKEMLEKELTMKTKEMSELRLEVSAIKEKHQAEVQESKLNLAQMVQQMTLLNTSLLNKQQQIISLTKSKKSLQSQLKESKKSIQQMLQTLEESRLAHRAQLVDLQEQHNEQLDRKNELIDNLQSQLDRNEVQLRKKEKELHQMSMEVRKISQIMLQKKEKEAEDNNRKIQQLQEQLQSVKLQLTQDQQYQLSQYHQQIEKIKLQLQETRIKNNQTLARQQQKQKEFEKSLYQYRLCSQQRQKQSRSIISELTVKYQQLAAKCIRLQQQLKESKQKIEKLTDQHSINQTQYKEQIQLKNKRVHQLQSELESKSNKVKLMQEKIEQLQEQKSKEQRQLTEKQQTLQSQYTGSLSELQQQNQQLLKRYQQSFKQLQGIQKQLQQVSEHNQQLSSQLQQKEELISQLNSQIYTLNKQYQEVKLSQIKLTDELSTLQQSHQSQQQQIRKSTQQIHRFNQQLQEKVTSKYVLQSELQLSRQRITSITQQISTLKEQIQQLNGLRETKDKQYDQIQLNYAELQTKYNDAKALNDKLIEQYTNQKQILAEQQKERQALQQKLHQLNKSKQQLLQSYKSLQQINKGLGRKCQQFLTSIQEQKTEYRKLQTKYLGEKNINENLKLLIENNQQQKKRLSVQLKQKTQTYQKLIDRIKDEELNYSSGNSNNLKTLAIGKQQNDKLMIEVNEVKAKYDDLKNKYEELRKTAANKSQLLQKKQAELKDLARKSQEYSKTIQIRVKQFESDYLQLESKYQQLLQNKKLYEKTIDENYLLKQQVKQADSKVSRMTLKIEQLEQRIRKINQQFILLEEQNRQLNKKVLSPSTLNCDEKISTYINKLKSEINDLRKENQILEDNLKKETLEKMRFKTNSDTSSVQIVEQSSKLKAQLEKLTHRNRYLLDMVAQLIDILKIQQFEKGSNPGSIKIEPIRQEIIAKLKEKLKQNKTFKQKLAEVQTQLIREKENKSLLNGTYKGISSSSSTQKKQTGSSSTYVSTMSNNLKTQSRDKSFSLKQDESGFNLNNRINSSKGSQYSNQKRQNRRSSGMDSAVKTLMNEKEQKVLQNYNMREKMRVKEIIQNSGKYYK